MAMIKKHTRECPYKKLQLATPKKHHPAITPPNVYRKIINDDLAIRQAAIRRYNLDLEQELFYFGRPMFQSLSYYGLGP